MSTESNGTRNGRNGRIWRAIATGAITLLAAVALAFAGWSASQVSAAESKTQRVAEQLAGTTAALKALQQEVERNRVARIKAEDLARQERAGIRAAVESLRWR